MDTSGGLRILNPARPMSEGHRTRKIIARVIVVLVAADSCTSPVCGCSPPESLRAVVYGQVTDSGGPRRVPRCLDRQFQLVCPASRERCMTGAVPIRSVGIDSRFLALELLIQAVSSWELDSRLKARIRGIPYSAHSG